MLMLMLMRPVLLVCLVMLTTAGCRSNTAPGDFHTLEPGPFRATYLIPDQNADFDLLELIVQSGEADHDGPEGLAHYVEHLVWLPQLNRSDQISSRHSNAWTSKLATGYFISGPSTDLPTNMARLASITEPFSLAEQFMIEEQEIVRREYELGILENPYQMIQRDIASSLYAGTALVREPIGTPESISAFTLDAARKLHQTTHTLSNAILIARGRLSASALQAEIDKLGSSEPLPPLDVSVPPNQTLRDEEQLKLPQLASQELVYAKTVLIPPELTGARLGVARQMLEDVLDSALPGGIAGPLRFDEFLARSFVFELFQHSDTHLEMRFSARPDAGVTLLQIQEAFELALHARQPTGIPASSFEKIKRRFLVDLEVIDNKSVFTHELLREQIISRLVPLGYADVLMAAKTITLNDVDRLYRSLLGDGRVVIRRL